MKNEWSKRGLWGVLSLWTPRGPCDIQAISSLSRTHGTNVSYVLSKSGLEVFRHCEYSAIKKTLLSINSHTSSKGSCGSLILSSQMAPHNSLQPSFSESDSHSGFWIYCIQRAPLQTCRQNIHMRKINTSLNKHLPLKSKNLMLCTIQCKVWNVDPTEAW